METKAAAARLQKKERFARVEIKSLVYLDQKRQLL